MYYKEYLLLRRGLLGFLATVFGLGVVVAVISTSGGGRTGNLAPTLLYVMPFLVAIFASIYGTSLGQDSGDTARLALVRPIARWRAAVTVFVTGICGVVIALLAGTVAFYVPLVAVYGVRALSPRPWFGWIEVALPLAFALAFYGTSAVASVFARRSLAIPAMIWPVAFLTYAMLNTGGPFGDVARRIDLINPIAYLMPGANILMSPALAHKNYGLFGDITPGWDVLILLVMFFVCITVAALQWRRLEA